MEFDAAEAGELDGLQPGDTITFRLVVTDTRGWIERCARPHTPLPVAVEAAPPRGSRRAAADCELIDQTGRRLRLSDLKAARWRSYLHRCRSRPLSPDEQPLPRGAAGVDRRSRETLGISSRSPSTRSTTRPSGCRHMPALRGAPCALAFLAAIRRRSARQVFGVAIVRNGGVESHLHRRGRSGGLGAKVFPATSGSPRNRRVKARCASRRDALLPPPCNGEGAEAKRRRQRPGSGTTVKAVPLFFVTVALALRIVRGVGHALTIPG